MPHLHLSGAYDNVCQMRDSDCSYKRLGKFGFRMQLTATMPCRQCRVVRQGGKEVSYSLEDGRIDTQWCVVALQLVIHTLSSYCCLETIGQL